MMNLLKQYKLTNNKKYANLWPRFLAYQIDHGFLSLPIILAGLFIVQQDAWQSMLSMAIILLALVIFPMSLLSLIYYPLFLSKWGRTLGKAVLGIKVVDEQEKLLDFKSAFFREFICKIVSAVALGIGFWAVLFDQNHQAWHDKLVGSYVIIENKNIAAGLITWILLLIAQAYFIWQIVSRVLLLVAR